jgi:hypothetical protein
MNVVEREELVMTATVLEEIKQLRETSVKVR